LLLDSFPSNIFLLLLFSNHQKVENMSLLVKLLQLPYSVFFIRKPLVLETMLFHSEIFVPGQINEFLH
jgi:hypothetical protein